MSDSFEDALRWALSTVRRRAPMAKRFIVSEAVFNRLAAEVCKKGMTASAVAVTNTFCGVPLVIDPYETDWRIEMTDGTIRRPEAKG